MCSKRLPNRLIKKSFRAYNTCGGEIVTDANTAAAACPYCDSPVVMTEQFAGLLKPDFVIPFQMDAKAAKAALTKHYKGKCLLPKVFKDQNHIEEIKGIYVPFWLFDAEAEADIRYRGTRVQTWSDSDYHYTRTSYYSIRRGGTLAFERVPVDGSSKMADDLMESIEPFDFSDAVDFQTAYLAGYFADKYDVDAEQSTDRANLRVRTSTEDTFSSTVRGYASVIPESSSIRLQNGRAKYALYPVWLLNTSWKGQRYTFAMNGQTGKFAGDLPMDKGLFWKWFSGVAGGVSLAALAISYLVWLF